MKPPLTSKELELRYRKARNPTVVEISGELTVQARAKHMQEFMSVAKRINQRKSLLLIALSEA